MDILKHTRRARLQNRRSTPRTAPAARRACGSTWHTMTLPPQCAPPRLPARLTTAPAFVALSRVQLFFVVQSHSRGVHGQGSLGTTLPMREAPPYLHQRLHCSLCGASPVYACKSPSSAPTGHNEGLQLAPALAPPSDFWVDSVPRPAQRQLFNHAPQLRRVVRGGEGCSCPARSPGPPRAAEEVQDQRATKLVDKLILPPSRCAWHVSDP